MRHAFDLEKAEVDEVTEGKEVKVIFNHWNAVYRYQHIHSGSLDFLKV